MSRDTKLRQQPGLARPSSLLPLQSYSTEQLSGLVHGVLRLDKSDAHLLTGEKIALQFLLNLVQLQQEQFVFFLEFFQFMGSPLFEFRVSFRQSLFLCEQMCVGLLSRESQVIFFLL